MWNDNVFKKLIKWSDVYYMGKFKTNLEIEIKSLLQKFK